jgi:hypothetical protein
MQWTACKYLFSIRIPKLLNGKCMHEALRHLCFALARIGALFLDNPLLHQLLSDGATHIAVVPVTKLLVPEELGLGDVDFFVVVSLGASHRRRSSPTAVANTNNRGRLFDSAGGLSVKGIQRRLTPNQTRRSRRRFFTAMVDEWPSTTRGVKIVFFDETAASATTRRAGQAFLFNKTVFEAFFVTATRS